MAMGLYIHIPFCLRRCHYCDFYSLRAEAGAINAYLDALKKEAFLCPKTKEITSVYLGGGTPTCLSLSQLRRLLEIVLSFPLHPQAEITCEANPGTISAEKLRVLIEKGVNRLSLGAQSFYNHYLRQLGRIHDVDDFLSSWRLARDAGFYNISFDLMYALPGMDLSEWENTLRLAVSLNPEHMSIYNLTLEPNRPISCWFKKGFLPPLPGEDEEADAFSVMHKQLEAAGYIHYEIASFARPGWQGRHNLNYWRRGEYIGLGPGASGFLMGERYTNVPSLKEYCTFLDEGKLPPQSRERLGDSEAMGEMMMLGLRMLKEGINTGNFTADFGYDPLTAFPKTLKKMLSLNLIRQTNCGNYILSDRGVIIADEIVQEFL